MATTYPPRVVRTEVDGKRVIKDEVLRSNLPPGPDGMPPPMHTTRVLTLEDGSVVYGCGDCETTGATRGDIRKHRNQNHGMTSSTRRSPVNAAASESPPLPYPGAETLGMTLYELLELADSVSKWEQVFGNQDNEIERLRKLLTEKDQELAEKTRELRAEQREHEKTKTRIARVLGLDKPAEDKTEVQV